MTHCVSLSLGYKCSLDAGSDEACLLFFITNVFERKVASSTPLGEDVAQHELGGWGQETSRREASRAKSSMGCIWFWDKRDVMDAFQFFRWNGSVSVFS